MSAPSPMPVPRGEILRRGLRGRCPNCGGPLVFDRGLRLRATCPAPGCGLRWQRGPGFYLGAMVANYTGALALLVPLFVATARGWLATGPAIAVGIAVGVGFPFLFYKAAWSLWITTYYFVLSDELPANAPFRHGPHRRRPPSAEGD